MVRSVRISAVGISARNLRYPRSRLCEACPRLERGDKLAGTGSAPIAVIPAEAGIHRLDPLPMIQP